MAENDPKPVRVIPPAPTPTSTSSMDGSGPHRVCEELTVSELLARVILQTEAGEVGTLPEDHPLMSRTVLLALEDGQAPTGPLVRVRIQRQVVRDGTVRWTPER